MATIGRAWANGTWRIGTWAGSAWAGKAITIPEQFTFSDVASASLGVSYSDTQPITGLTAGTLLTATNGLLSNNGGQTWSASVLFVAGLTLVSATLVSGVNYLDEKSVTVTVNGVSDTFSIVNKAHLGGTSIERGMVVEYTPRVIELRQSGNTIPRFDHWPGEQWLYSIDFTDVVAGTELPLISVKWSTDGDSILRFARIEGSAAVVAIMTPVSGVEVITATALIGPEIIDIAKFRLVVFD